MLFIAYKSVLKSRLTHNCRLCLRPIMVQIAKNWFTFHIYLRRGPPLGTISLNCTVVNKAYNYQSSNFKADVLATNV